ASRLVAGAGVPEYAENDRFCPAAAEPDLFRLEPDGASASLCSRRALAFKRLISIRLTCSGVRGASAAVCGGGVDMMTGERPDQEQWTRCDPWAPIFGVLCDI